MGIASFVFGRDIFRTKLGEEIIVDCTIQLVTDLNATVTKHPVQGGSLISDHVTLDPLTLKIEGLISESPIGDIQNEVSAIAGGLAAGVLGRAGASTKVGGASLVGAGLGSVLGSRLGGAMSGIAKSRQDGTYPQSAMKRLMDARAARTPFLIRTFFWTGVEGRKLYDNMVITQLSFPQTAAEGRSLRFSLTCEKVQIVNLTVGTVSPEMMKGTQVANSATPVTDRGRQGTEEPKAKAVKTSSDLMTELNDLTGGAF